MQTTSRKVRQSTFSARQVRLGVSIAAGVAALAGLRVISGWHTDRSWAAAILFVSAAVLLAGSMLLPWERLVRARRAHDVLFGWYVVQVAVLLLFCAHDHSAQAIYPAGAALFAASASALSSARRVAALSAVAMAGYLLLAGREPPVDLTLVALTAGIMGAVMWFCTATAANRARRDTERDVAHRRAEALLENASDAVIAVRPGGDIVYASPSVRAVLGYDPAWLNSDRLTDITHPDYLASVTEWVMGVYTSPPGRVSRIESRTRRGDGTWIDVEVLGTSRLDEPSLNAAVLSVRDISERKALESELTAQAFQDSLTGMPNRALFQDRLDHALARNQRDGGRITLLLIDLDDFKLVNDSLGHTAGDQLIATAAQRLHRQVRPADTLARLGGDEFAVLVEDVTDLEAEDLAARLLAALRQPLRLGTRDVTCTASVGVATLKAGDDPDSGELLRNADLAMYAAKAAGRDRFAIFDPTMYTDILREADERAEVERALANKEFLVYYQPIVDLPSSKLIGLEALVRWEHPTRGLLGPNSFIPLAEATGLIVPLGRWVLDEACRQLATWMAGFPSARALRMSVNLSARQFQHEGLVEEVRTIIETTGVDPAQIVLEITESLLMQDTDATVQTLQRLKDLGLRLAIDDFGTGYSSLSYLKRFPVDILKIDRSFVDGITTQPEDATLAEAVVQLGRALRLQTVAEGIETQEQWSTLQDLGCDLGQGYLFARPTDADEISTILGKAPP